MPFSLVSTASDSGQGSNNEVRELFQQCLFDELHISALMATANGHMKYLTASPIERSDRPEYFQGKALHLLRQHLHKCLPIMQQIIIDIVFLTSVEIYNRNFDGARMLLSLSNELAFSCGLGRLKHYVGKMCWGSDMFLVNRTLLSPVLDLS